MGLMRRLRILLMVLVAAGLVLAGFAAGFSLSQGPGTLAPPAPAGEFPILREVWGILGREYVEPEKLAPTPLEYGAIRGLLQALGDPYTAHLDPDTYRLEITSIEGKYEGIGAHVTKEKPDSPVLIIAPIPDSPAQRAGLLSGDLILEVEGKPTATMNLQEAVLKIRGPRGAPVRLLIQHREKKDPVEVVIVRAEIKVETVRYEMKGEMGYLQVTHFTERSSADFRRALVALVERGAQGIVLDLRNNPGGLLPAVVEMGDELLEEGIVLYEVDNQGQRKEWRSRPGGAATRLPLVVLVNQFSASGSEVLAGAVQDRGRAKLLGTKTFGKGSVNTIHLLSDGSALYLTSARWLTPGERLIEGQGLVPDLVVEAPEEELRQGKDPQLDRALEFLRSQAVSGT